MTAGSGSAATGVLRHCDLNDLRLAVERKSSRNCNHRISASLRVLEKLGVVVCSAIPRKKTANWQRVDEPVEPVVCLVVDVRVLTQKMTQQRRVGGVVGV